MQNQDAKGTQGSQGTTSSSIEMDDTRQVWARSRDGGEP